MGNALAHAPQSSASPRKESADPHFGQTNCSTAEGFIATGQATRGGVAFYLGPRSTAPARAILEHPATTMTARPRILILSAYYFPFQGGSETHAREVATYLAANGFRVIIVTKRAEQEADSSETV